MRLLKPCPSLTPTKSSIWKENARRNSHVHPPGFVAEVVAFAFGLAAASFFPAILLGIFDKRTNREGAITGMVTGLAFTAFYIIGVKFYGMQP